MLYNYGNEFKGGNIMISRENNRVDFVVSFTLACKKMDALESCDYLLFLLTLQKYASEYEKGNKFLYIDVAENSFSNTNRVEGYINDIHINEKLSEIGISVIDDKRISHYFKVKSIGDTIAAYPPNKFYVDCKEIGGKFNIWFKNKGIGEQEI
jgi:hypothetical protein